MALASSTFDGSENPLSEGGNWFSGQGLFADLKKVTGTAQATVVETECAARWVASNFQGDQFSQATLIAWGGDSGEGVSVMTRIQSDTDGSCYLIFSGANYSLLRAVDNGVSLSFISLFATGILPVVNDVIRLESFSSMHRVILNGKVIGGATDIVHTSGQPGIHVFDITGHAGLNQLDNWSGGDLIEFPESAMSFVQPIKQYRVKAY